MHTGSSVVQSKYLFEIDFVFCPEVIYKYIHETTESADIIFCAYNIRKEVIVVCVMYMYDECISFAIYICQFQIRWCIILEYYFSKKIFSFNSCKSDVLKKTLKYVICYVMFMHGC